LIDKKTQGKKNKAAGQRFELKVRKDLEGKGWIVSKWMNNVSDYPEENINKPSEEREDRKLVPAKHKFRGPGIPMSIGTGFPDFIVYRINNGKGPYHVKVDSEIQKVLDDIKKRLKKIDFANDKWIVTSPEIEITPLNNTEVTGVEAKSNGYLDKEEKEKCKWLVANNIFSKILIAKKGKKRGEIEYNEFKS